jgi:hypothetical protein
VQLRRIRQINVVAIALLLTGLLGLFGGIAAGVVFDSELLFYVLFALGGAAGGVCLLLSFVIDRVRCPRCGKPFNRPVYRNWLARNLARTRPHWSCVHRGHGARKQ